MKTPHYLRFVQALVLAASVPACVADAEPTSPSDTAPAERRADVAEPTPGVEAPADPTPPATDPVADAGEPAEEVDAGLPFSSGPIVPPELPARLA